MVGNQRLEKWSFFWGWVETSPRPPSKREMQRASRHEQYDVETGGAGGANGRLGKARMAERTGTGETSGTGGTGGTSGNKKSCF